MRSRDRTTNFCHARNSQHHRSSIWKTFISCLNLERCPTVSEILLSVYTRGTDSEHPGTPLNTAPYHVADMAFLEYQLDSLASWNGYRANQSWDFKLSDQNPSWTKTNIKTWSSPMRPPGSACVRDVLYHNELGIFSAWRWIVVDIYLPGRPDLPGVYSPK